MTPETTHPAADRKSPIRATTLPGSSFSSRQIGESAHHDLKCRLQVRVCREDHSNIKASVNRPDGEVDAQLNIDALLFSLFIRPGRRVAQGPGYHRNALAFPSSALPHVGCVRARLSGGVRPPCIDTDFIKGSFVPDRWATTDQLTDFDGIDLPFGVRRSRPAEALTSATVHILSIDKQYDPISHFENITDSGVGLWRAINNPASSLHEAVDGGEHCLNSDGNYDSVNETGVLHRIPTCVASATNMSQAS